MAGFPAVWAQLRKQGWTSKRPTGLSNDHTYMRPGKAKNGERGVDYFIGAEEVLKYLDKQVLDEARKTAKYQVNPAQSVVRESQDGSSVITNGSESEGADRGPSGSCPPSSGARRTEDDVRCLADGNYSVDFPRRDIRHNDATTIRSRSKGAEADREISRSYVVSSSVIGIETDTGCVVDGSFAVEPLRSNDTTSSAGMIQNGTEPEESVASSRLSPVASLRTESPHISRSQETDAVVYVGDSGPPSPQRNLDADFRLVQNDVDEQPRRSARLYACSDDINNVGANENPGEFGGLVSHVENGDSASESSGRGDDLETASEGASEGDLVDLFDNSLLDAVGGVAGISSGSIHGSILKDMEVNGWSNPVSYNPFPFLDEPYESRPDGSLFEDYPQLYAGQYGPTLRAREAASTASGAFLFFVRPQLWEDIAEASSEYFEDNLDERVKEQYAKQVTREKKKPGLKKSTEEVIRAGLLRTPSITGRELCNFVGLLIARAVVPNKEKIENHWKTTSEGAIPRGMFGLYMKRDRFMHISRNLHFSSNADPRAASDRAWKLRPVIESLQDRFQAGYMPPPVMAFDEAMLPSRSSFNRMRVYMKDKPHKWGTKLFMLCCSQSAYCMRFEVYCGKRQSSQATVTTDTNAGPAAVVRNLIEVFGSNGTSKKRLVVTDRFYTSPSLAMQLLTLGFYSIGTVMTNRRGFCKAIVEKKKKRPAGVHRGEFVVAENKQVPCIKAVCWWDNRPVHLLAAGGSVKQDRVVRREKSGEQAEVSCPRIMKDYQTFMGGVDVHDQLRLQRYSLQLALKYKKYYKSLFLGFLDLAIVNAFIVYNSRRATEGKSKLTHVKFLKKLHQELAQLQEGAWDAVRRMQATPTKNRVARMQRVHIPIQVDEWREGKQGRKRRQRACKVCSVLKGASEAKGGETTFYCSTCKLHSSSKKATATRVYLCNKVKHTHNSEAVSCFEIWHRHWRNGTLLPPSQRKKKIRARKTATVDEEAKSESSGERDDDNSPRSKRQRQGQATPVV